MATSANKHYGRGAVYGSLAYDFNNPELYREEYETAQTPAARPQPKTQTRVRTRAKPVVHTRQSIEPFSVIGIMIAAFLFVTAILAQAQLVGISTESVALQNQLSELKDEQTKLRIAYESAFNMEDIEEYAIKSLGMQRPQADQILYIDTAAPNKAVVIAQSDSDNFVDRVSDFLSGLGAYFR
ncbi:MAG: hypothetical protein E7472_04520 [Ruminococcaceae bacterium]|nr:hypothetical protein [Oscillospiraceae bacterium]